MPIRVLTYHSHNISGPDYAENDHVALEQDLAVLKRANASILSLSEIAQLVMRGETHTDEIVVGLSFDDGPIFDWQDFTHPKFGFQRGFANILRSFIAEAPALGQRLRAMSFVIASPAARQAMERSPDCGYPTISGWLSDSWWSEALDSGLFEIGNHSWDHVHEVPQYIAASVERRGDFSLINNDRDADAEIRRAADYIRTRAGGGCTLFAYPYGHTNEFLVRDYLPRNGRKYGMVGAFDVGDEPINESTSVWKIPRIVCGLHWQSPEQLARLLTH